MRLTDRELNWVLDSPVFYDSTAYQCAPYQLHALSSISLPGPVIYPNLIECPDTLYTSSLLSDRSAREHCALSIEQDLSSFHSGRLGLVFEKYLENILREKYGTENVLTRVAVRESSTSSRGVKTWGEFDFLVHDTGVRRIEHWESSIKFYLQVDDSPEWNRCWGPGVRDRLDLKGTKTFLQQLPLSSTELGQHSIPLQWSALPLVKIVFAKGTIFYQWEPSKEPFSKRLERIVRPVGLSQDHLKSWWIMPSCIHGLRSQYPDAKLSIIPRRYWMTGVPTDLLKSTLEDWDTFLTSLDDRLKELSARQECLLLGLHQAKGPSEMFELGFVAAPHFVSALSQQK